MFAIVPRETFVCWFFAAMPFCRSAGRSAGRSVLLLVYVCLMVFCLSAGLSAALLAVLLFLLCAACVLVYWATAASLLFVCLCLVFCCWWSHCHFTVDLCRLHLLAGLSLLPSCQSCWSMLIFCCLLLFIFSSIP